jgi:hypothetical protein
LIGPAGLARRKARLEKAMAASAAAKEPIPLPPVAAPMVKARLYAELAQRYEADGRLKEALELWRAAALLAGLRTASEQELHDRVGYTAVSE